MKNLSLSILKIFLKNSYSLENLFGSIKKGPKGIAKTIGISLIGLYLVGVIGFSIVAQFINTYNILATVDQQKLMPVISIILGAIVIFFFGFTTAAVNYYTGNGEEQILSMPFTPRQFFSAKFMVSVISDATLGVLLLLTAGIVYGVHEGLLTHPTFWLGLISCAALLVSVTVFIIHLLLVLIMYFFPGLRKKKWLTTISSILLIAFVVPLALMMSSSSSAVFAAAADEDPNLLMGGLILGLADKLDGIFLTDFAHKAFCGNVLISILFLAISALIVFVLAPLISGMYIKSLDGFSDSKTKRLDAKEVQSAIKKSTKDMSLFQSLLVRDIRGILREPSFFANGPLLLIIMPAIMLISGGIGFMTASEGSVTQILGEMRTDILKGLNAYPDQFRYFIILIGAAIVFFMGVGANIASTSFSREGKTMYTLKAMPIDYDVLVEVKVVHAFIYCVLAFLEIVILTLVLGILLQLPFSVGEYLKMYAGMLIVSAPACIFMIFVDMFIDTVNPKLSWDNPVFAFKNNMNTLISILACFVAVGIFVGLGIGLKDFGNITLGIITVLFVILAAPTGVLYNKYAMKKLPVM